MRKAQVWTADYVLSLLIFMIAAVTGLTLMHNGLQEDEYEAVRSQALDAAELLGTEGYPRHWTNSTVVRAGIMSDDRLSLRKINELSSMDETGLKQALRLTDDFLIYITNDDNETVSYSGVCGIGALSIPVMPRNVTLAAAALVGDSNVLSSQVNATRYLGDGLYANLSQQDVLIIEGNISGNTTAAKAGLALHRAAERGITVIVVGDPGIGLFGMNITYAAISGLEAGPDGRLGFAPGEDLAVAGQLPLLTAPSDPAVTAYAPVATATSGPGNAGIATWIYNDARIWYFSTLAGTRQGGGSLESHIVNQTRNMITVPRPVCANATMPAAEQLALHTRTLAHHDELVTVHVLVWRQE